MTYTSYTPLLEDLEANADATKVAILIALVNENLIDVKTAEEWCETHTIIFRKKNIFRTITDKWFKSKVATLENLQTIVVKKI